MAKEERNQYSRETYALLKRLHLCVNCKKQDAYTLSGRPRCYECTERNNMNAKKSRENKPKEDINKYRNALRQRHREEHRCIYCGKQLVAADRHTSCYRCRLKANKLKVDKRRKNGVLARDTLRDNGICWNCSKRPVMPGKKLCAECYKTNPVVSGKVKPDNALHSWHALEFARRMEVKERYGKEVHDTGT